MVRNISTTTDRRIDALLTLLADNALVVISGSKIAREIGVTRSTVWRWVEKLRSLGVKVKGHPRSGYQVEQLPDALVPGLIRRGLAGTPFGKRIFHFFKTDSTNNVALRLGQEGEAHGAVVVAEEQTAGRGRVGRAWHSEKTSGIYVSILLRPQITPMQAPLLTLLAGLAVRDAVFELAGAAPDIRWPNDLLLDGRKFCGILTEMHAEPDRVQYVVIGIGLNVNNAKMPAELAATATSLRMATNRTHARLDLLVKLLRSFDRYYNQFLHQGAEPVVSRFAEVSSYAKGKRVRVTSAAETFTGTTTGLESNGLLRVQRDDGRQETVLAGDVTEA